MHRIRVIHPRYEQSRLYAGQIGEVIGHWGADNSESGRLGYLVEFPDGSVVGVAEDEAEDVSAGDEL